MHSYPTDLTPAVITASGALVFLVIMARLLAWYQSRIPRLRMLTGSSPQRAALRAALAPVVREFLPLLERAGQEVRAIILVPTLSGSDGQPLAAEVEQLGGSNTFIVRLAHGSDPRCGTLTMWRAPSPRTCFACIASLRPSPSSARRARMSAFKLRRHPSPAVTGSPRCPTTPHKTKPRRRWSFSNPIPSAATTTRVRKPWSSPTDLTVAPVHPMGIVLPLAATDNDFLVRRSRPFPSPGAK